MPSGRGKAAGNGANFIYVIAFAFLAVQVASFAHGLFDRSIFAFSDSLFILIFSSFVAWSFVHGYRWARWCLAIFAVAMLLTSDGGLLSAASGPGKMGLVSYSVYSLLALVLTFAPLSLLGALETARTGRHGPDEVLPDRSARRRGRYILIAMIALTFGAQLTWMMPAWWRAGTLPGLTEGLVFAAIALIAYGFWRRSDNARAWAWLLSCGASFWFLALGVFAPEPNDFFIAIGLAHLAIPSALVSWRSVQVYFGDKDLDAKWEYVQPTPRRPKALGEEARASEVAGTKSVHRSL